MQLSTQPPPSIFKLFAHDLRWRLVGALAHSDYRVHELVAVEDLVAIDERLGRHHHERPPVVAKRPGPVEHRGYALFVPAKSDARAEARRG